MTLVMHRSDFISFLIIHLFRSINQTNNISIICIIYSIYIYVLHKLYISTSRKDSNGSPNSNINKTRKYIIKNTVKARTSQLL